MTELPPANQPTFRLSMLIYDRRFRSLTIQTVVFILVMLAAAWLVNNTVQNLAAMGKTFSFSFLDNRAGYDIPFSLIPYTSDDSHMRAAMVGLLNTLLVSALGCLFATVVGVTTGVLRLSNNWLIAGIATIYVEIFRNIPLLLWILVILAIFTDVMPAPRDYRGDDAAASMILFDSVAPTNRYTAVPRLAMENAPGPMVIGNTAISGAVIAYAVALIAALLIWRWVRAWATDVQNATGRRPVTWWISVLLFLGPLAGLTWLFDAHLIPPALQGFNFSGGMNLDNGFVVLVLALTLYTGAFIAEIVRAGIMSVSRGQSEAAMALGMRARPVMALVILPQALRVIIPPMISQFLNLTKNSSLAIAVGFPDLRATLGGTTLNQTGREMESMILMMGVYLVISLLISAAMNVYNARVRLKER
ncbi:ABC transporter permease subunit [Paracoccus sp. Z118]|uniref:amino acid ABC transporter permease n=1 Tax=Paracoccus sp. Z118 TaxID=2851017 RepID=UPI001C2C09A9|nr:ABC transporter permease subunit [Paracoccus sp. Z118]MBV0891289.1 ABC transporter permease subunit [Paracoccus sp. Z118]